MSATKQLRQPPERLNMASEAEKMAAGEWYCCLDAELDRLRLAARRTAAW